MQTLSSTAPIATNPPLQPDGWTIAYADEPVAYLQAYIAGSSVSFVTLFNSMSGIKPMRHSQSARARGIVRLLPTV